MKNARRFFVGGLVVFALLFSVGSQSLAAKSRKRCPVRIPDSLLTLYLKSDLIVRGTISGEKFLKKTHEYDYGYIFNAQKNLRVSKTLKGVHANSAAFVVSQYKPTKTAESGEPEAEENNFYSMNAGEEALFFLVKNEDENYYELADDSSGMKKLDAADLDVYAKRVGELNGIVKTKKNQIARLTEWLVQLIEEPLTRREGTLDLGKSFAALDDKSENEPDEEESPEEPAEIKEPIVLDENFSTYNAPEIAELMTNSQKQRISNVFLNLIGEDLQKINRGGDGEDDGEIYPDYGLMNIVEHWDKTNPPMSAYAFLVNFADTNPRRVSYLMQIISGFLENEELNEIAGEYESALSEADDEELEYEEVKTEKVEFAAVENESNSETETPEVVQVQINPADESQKVEETKAKPAAKITYKKYKAILFEKFTKQYGIAIAQSSASN